MQEERKKSPQSDLDTFSRSLCQPRSFACWTRRDRQRGIYFGLFGLQPIYLGNCPKLHNTKLIGLVQLSVPMLSMVLRHVFSLFSW